MAGFEALSNFLVPHRKKVHVAIFILTILMIPGALKALEPIDMESYDMESPELTAERTINEEFSTTEIILGFVVSVRAVSYTHLRAHETDSYLVCRLLLEKKTL